ncbi:MAG: FkbM family methyltransferase [Chlorobia bacterium]|nr:FkbM family methyltransferase [Fimbriimonadaceae bacterium]
MSVLEGLRRVKTKALLRHRYGPEFGLHFWNAGIKPPTDASLSPEGELCLPGLGFKSKILDTASTLALSAHEALFQLKAYASAELAYRDDHISIAVQGVQLHGYSHSDIVTAKEIFVDELYSFHLDSELVVIDIGMNVGLASLYFAKRHRCVVHGYELFPSTANVASRNIDLNPDLAPNITVNAFGIFDRDSEFELISRPEARNAGSLIWKREELPGIAEKVETREATSALKPILDQYPDRKAVLKLDAEGAEYEILQNLFESGTLQRFDLIMMEWHERPSHPIETVLTQLASAGFVYTSRREPASMVGFINAWKSSNISS